MTELPKLKVSLDTNVPTIPDSIRSTIMDMIVEHEMKRGKKPKNLVVSEVIHYYLSEGARSATGVSGSLTKYMGLDIMVLDRDDLLIIVG